MAAGWLTPTSPRCLGPLATTARIGSPRSRRASPGENLTRPSRRSSLRSTAAAPMALKCIVFSSGDRDEVWGGRSTWGAVGPLPGPPRPHRTGGTRMRAWGLPSPATDPRPPLPGLRLENPYAELGGRHDLQENGPPL